MNTDNTTPASDAPRRKKRWPKVLGGIVVVLVLLVAFAPMLIASLGKGAVESTINDTIKGSVAIDSLSLSWLGGQSITGLELRDPDGNVVANVESLRTELSLLAAIQGELNLGQTVIAGLDGDIKLDEAGVSNLQKAIEPNEPSPETDEPASVPPTLAIDAKIVGGKVTVTPHGGEPAELSDLEVGAVIESMTAPVTLTARGKTSQGGKTGNVAVDGSLKNLFTADGVVTADKVDADITVDVTDTPTAMLDGLAPLDGLLGKALGANIAQIKLAAKGTLDAQDITASVDTDRVDAPSLKAKVADGVVSLAEADPITATVTPALVEALVALGESDTPLRLKAPVDLELTPKAVRVPLDAAKIAEATLDFLLTAKGAIELAGDERLGDVTINNLRASASAERLADALGFSLNADLVTAGQPGQVNISGEARDIGATDANGDPIRVTADATANIKNLPAALLNRLAPVELAAAEGDAPARTLDYTWFGSSLNIDAAVTTDDEGAMSIGLTAKTDRLDAHLPLAVADRVNTTKPGRIAWDAPRAAIEALGFDDVGIAFADVTKISITGLELAAPMPAEGEPAFQPDKTKVAGKLTVGNLVYNVDENNSVALTQLRADIAGESLVNMTVDASTQLLVAASAEDLRSQIGESATVSIDATIKTPNLTEFNPASVDAAVNTTLAAAGGQVRELFGSDAKITLTKTPQASDNFKLVVTSKRVNATVPGTLTLGDNATLKTQPSTLDATVTPKLVASLKENSTANLKIAPTTIPLTGFSLDKLKAEVTGGFDRIVLAVEGDADGTVLTGIEFVEPLVFDGPAKTLVANLTGRALAPGQTDEGSPIEVTANLADIFGADGSLAIAASKIDARAKIKKLPTPIVDALARQGGKLPPVLGPLVDLDATVKTTGGEKPNGSGKVIVRSANLTADADLKLTDGVIALVDAKPGKVTWKLTPEAYAALTTPEPAEGATAAAAEPVARLLEPTTIELALNRFSAKLPAEGESFDIRTVVMNANLSAASVKLLDTKTKQPVTINKLSGSLNSAGFDKGIDVVAKGAVETPGVPKPGDLDINAKLSELFGPDGEFNKTAYNAGIKAQLIEIPGALAEALFNQGSGSGKVAALIGESGTIMADVDLRSGKGAAKITIDSQNTKLLIDGRIEDGVLLLNQDATASVLVTKELTDFSIGGGSVADIVTSMIFSSPTLRQAVESVEPIKLRVAADGFRAPIENFDITKLVIEKATLNPGKLKVANAGLINTLVTLPQTSKKLASGKVGDYFREMSSKTTIQAWFTDLPFSMKDGVLRMDRMDMMLGENYQVALWGTVNLSDEATTARGETIGPQSGHMVLGLAERAMRRVYGINAFKEEPNYVDQFVMKGPLETLGPNKGDMTARIVALTAFGAAGVGDEGIGILKTIGEAGRLLKGEDRSPPPPAAPKTPWPTEEEEQAARDAEANKNADPNDPNAPAAVTNDPDTPERELTEEEKRELRRKKRREAKEREKEKEKDAEDALKNLLRGVIEDATK